MFLCKYWKVSKESILYFYNYEILTSILILVIISCESLLWLKTVVIVEAGKKSIFQFLVVLNSTVNDCEVFFKIYGYILVLTAVDVRHDVNQNAEQWPWRVLKRQFLNKFKTKSFGRYMISMGALIAADRVITHTAFFFSGRCTYKVSVSILRQCKKSLRDFLLFCGSW